MRRTTTRTGLARKSRNQRYKIRSWVNRLSDIPAFILGNGPSLDGQEVKLLEDYFTIGINRAFYKIDPTILFWQDMTLWNSEYQRLHATQAIKVSRDVSDPRKIYYNFHLKGGGFRFEPDTTHTLYGRGSTGPLAVQLAVGMGCRPIVLLGMDCKRSPDGKSDFWGENKYWTDSTLSNCVQGWESVKEQCPVEIANCSDNDLWEKEQLSDVVQTIDARHRRGRQSYVAQILNLPRKE